MIRRILDSFFALILLLAAALKAQEVLLQSRAGYALGPEFPRGWFRALAIAIEWLMAFWLLSGAAALWARRAAVVLLGLFVGVAGWSLARGESDCGCFGALRVHPGWTLTLDAVLLAAFLVSARADAVPTRCSWPAVFRATLLTVAVPAALLRPASSPLAIRSSADVVFLDAKSLIGQRLPLIEYVDDPLLREEVASGEKTVIVVRRACETCRKYLRSIENQFDPLGADRVWLMDLDTDVARPFASRFASIPLRRNMEYLGDVPLRLQLRNGVVEAIMRP